MWKALVCLGIVLAATGCAGAKGAAQLPPDFVALRDVAPGIVEDMRYATPHNFTGAPVPGYEAGICLLTRPAAEALAAVQRELAGKGFGLIVWDCYRPERAVASFMAWTSNSDQSMKTEFFPRVDKAKVVELGYIAARSGHSRGSTVDLGIVPAGTTTVPHWQPGTALADCTAPKGVRFEDGALDFGTGYDCFDERAHGADTSVSPAAQANRALLADIMKRHGFAPYAQEWWHFKLASEPYPGTAFDVPITPRP